ncbi:MAG: hypothetical protein GY861_13450, partial [bacterium]|nr:hypothetical protein [bacterium]
VVSPSFAKAAPDAFNWNDQGKVTKVKNQGQCGSCWAFSATGNLESVHAIKSGNLVEFSEQQLVDCDKVDQGCNGGLMENAFDYLKQNSIMLESDYSYKGRGGSCSYDESKGQLKVSSYQFSPEDEGQVKQFLYENGALAVAMNATTLQFYFGGIYSPWFSWTCSPKALNHGVLLVGYGVENDKEYWIVKNSWGASWGEKGYFRIIRGKGACGINTHVLTATVDQ